MCQKEKAFDWQYIGVAALIIATVVLFEQCIMGMIKMGAFQ